MNGLATLGVHLSLDRLPMESWVGYETRLRPSADYVPAPDKLAYLRSRVFDVYLAETGAAAICAAVLRGLLVSSGGRSTTDATVSPPETVHCFLLLVQELASLALQAPSSARLLMAPSPFAVESTADEFADAGAGWLLQFVASEYEQAENNAAGKDGEGYQQHSRSRRAEQLMSYCLLLPPALLWGGGASAQEPTRGLDASWTFIDRMLLQRQGRSHWNGAMATHVCRGLLHHCHSGATVESVKQWLCARPRLMAALLTPHWRLVVGAVEAMLGKQGREDLLGRWETALYAAEVALTPSPAYPEETIGVFVSVLTDDPVIAAVALHAVCLRVPTTQDERSADAMAGDRSLAADITVGIVKQIFSSEDFGGVVIRGDGDPVTAEPLFTPSHGQGDGGCYQLGQDLSPSQRTAVTFVQLLAAGCTTQALVQSSELDMLAYSTTKTAEQWLVTLCWRLLVSLVDAVPWLLLAVGGERSLRDPTGAQALPPTAACAEAVFFTLAEWASLSVLGRGAAGQVALVLFGEHLSALVQRCASGGGAAAAGPADATAQRRVVGCMDRLVGALSAESVRGLPPHAVEKLVASVPHLGTVLRPR